MIGLRMLFTAGRYHATSWDHHVNEGIAEWPPAPWRILRALVAASYRLPPEVSREPARQLVELLSALPIYRVPPSSAAHLRHYMPTDDSSVKVLDTFVAVGQGARTPSEVLVWWPEVVLSQSEHETLERLCEEIAYLGRAESWVELSVVDEVEGKPNVVPASYSADEGTVEQVRLMAAQTPGELARWLEGVEAELGGASASAKKATEQKKKKARGLELPRTVWSVLHANTGELRRYGWSGAPGSRWVDYAIHQPLAVRPARQIGRAIRPQGVVFDLESAVLPRFEQALVIAERMRSAAMKESGGGDRAHWQLSGKHDEEPRRGHDHAYFLPLEGAKGRIDRILVWAEGGFEPEAWAALQRLAASRRQLHGAKNHPIHLILSGYGRADELAAVLGDRGVVVGPSTSWVSATPFVPPRHPKLRGGQWRDTPAEQLAKLCTQVVGVEPVEVRVFAGETRSRFGWNRFVRVRKKDRGRLGVRPAEGFELRFDEPVAGPICLGYGSHFGLGRFEAKRRGRGPLEGR